jgi:23S rRNA (guanosine2251-2'-O)-methyltransferase
MRSIVLIVHNVRSALNVGALFRTASGAGVSRVYLTGYTPGPASKGKLFLTDAQKSLKKTALGAEEEIPYETEDIDACLRKLKKENYSVVALEQTENSVDYRQLFDGSKIALIVGNEPQGIESEVLSQADRVIEIPMHGQKNSLNVAVAAGIALYSLRSSLE